MGTDMQAMDISQSVEQLKRHLRAFLTSRGVEISSKGFWKCFAHSENDASAHFLPDSDETAWYCHGCSNSGTIFDAANALDGLPLSGRAWITETLPKLCDEFNIELRGSSREMSAAEQKESDTYQAYEHACRLVIDSPQTEAVQAKLASYGWTPKTLRLFGIGTIASYDKFVRTLVKKGYTKDFLKEICLTDMRMFRPECLVFSLKDIGGKVIGFSARYLEFDEQETKLSTLKNVFGPESVEYKQAKEKSQPKYVHTSSRNPIFKKKDLLFGFHSAKGTSRTLYIVEGNPDCVTASDRGLVNSMAICGNSFGESHFDIILAHGFTHLVFAMDTDNGGINGTRRIVELSAKYLAKRPGIRVEIMDMPAGKGKMDPDLFIRENGLTAFRRLPRRSYQYWHWQEQMLSGEGISVAGKACRQIVDQPDPLLRWDMLVNLQRVVDIPVEVLWETVVRVAKSAGTPAAADILATAPMMALFRENLAEARRLVEQTRARELMDLEAGDFLVSSELLPMRQEEASPAEISVNQKTELAALQWA